MCNDSDVRNSSYCGPYTLHDVTSIKQFARDYARVINKYEETLDYPEEIHQPPSLKILLGLAEKEFGKKFSKPPTYAVYAPGQVNLCGENANSNDGKVLSMATQLVTVIVGTRRIRSRRCKVKTLSREIDEETYTEFFIGSTDFDNSDGPEWANYIRAVAGSFSIPREQIPGFKALIISSIPIKKGLGSSAALTVATYTFLEAITNFHAFNNLEKAIACQNAEGICKQGPCGISETLLPVVGVEGKVMECDSRSLQVGAHDWDASEIDLILVNSNQDTIDSVKYEKRLIECREVAFALNLTSLRNATIPKVIEVESLFPSQLIQRACHIIGETDRVCEATGLIKQQRWRELGSLMWASHRSIRDNFGSSCVQIEYIMGAIQNIDGVHGARIIGRGHGGFVLVMVKRQAIKDVVNALSRIAECQEYQVIRPFSGARILYSDENNDHPLQIEYSTGGIDGLCSKKAKGHHLVFGDYESYELHHDAIYGVTHDKSFTPLKAMSIRKI